MHKTTACERRKALQKTARDARALQKAARAPAARQGGGAEAARSGDVALAEVEALRLQARLEDLTVWKNGECQVDPEARMPTAIGWPAGARAIGRGARGSAGKMDVEAARRREMKAEALGI